VTVVEEVTPLLLEKLQAGSIDVVIVALPGQAATRNLNRFR
jgi:hypothetical protein